MFTYNCQEPIFFKEPLFSSNTKNKFRIIHNNTNSQTKEPSQTIILSDQKNKIFTKAAENHYFHRRKNDKRCRKKS